MKLVFVISLLIAWSAQAADFHNFKNSKECESLESEVFHDDLKRDHLSTKGMPSHWLKPQNADGYRYVNIMPTIGTPFATPDGLSKITGYGGYVRNGKIVRFQCWGGDHNWMMVISFEEDLAHYKEQQAIDTREKQTKQSFLKSKGI